MNGEGHSSNNDSARCRLYQALLRRDPKFDGRFYVGVRTTGVYCRSICPAPKPKEQNCEFYRSAAEAELAGYRPCLRCRPETAPGSPAWRGTGATVSRAVRMIEEGYLDCHSVSEMAGLLGIGTRHLSRLFSRHMGASPRDVARTRRIQTAKRLITDSDMPMTRVAFEAGFGSVRRFNDAFLRINKRAPSTFRNGCGGRGAA